MKWVLIAVIYQTQVTPSFFDPDAVNFYPRVIQLEFKTQKACEAMGQAIIENNPTEPRWSHPFANSPVYGPKANFKCARIK